MHSVNEDVEMTVKCEKLCLEKLQEKLNLSPKVSFFTKSEELKDMHENDYSGEALRGKYHTYVTKTEMSHIHNFQGLDKKNLLKSDFLDCESEAPDDVKMQDLSVKTSSPIVQSEKEFNVKEDGSSDVTTDEAISKYETTYGQNVEKLKDVSVQTIGNESRTDKQCQCDLSITDSSSFISTQDLPPKKIKLKNRRCCCLGNIHWKSESFELQEVQGTKTKCFESISASRIKTSRIRVGLSKRVRPPPLHIMN